MNVPKRVNDQWRSLQPRLAKVQPKLSAVQTKTMARVRSINSAPRRADRPGVVVDGLLTEIDHVAIAVRDIEAAVQWYEETFGAEVVHREVVPHDDVEEALLAVSDSYIQLVTPLSDKSPVARFLDQRGEGLHHVGFRVKDCAAALESVRASGSKLIDEAPRPGSRGTTVAFVHPKGAFGTLVELVEE
jgi:methylmalonyl-CoA/ethylmalonyl-CoA epimerase